MFVRSIKTRGRQVNALGPALKARGIAHPKANLGTESLLPAVLSSAESFIQTFDYYAWTPVDHAQGLLCLYSY